MNLACVRLDFSFTKAMRAEARSRNQANANQAYQEAQPCNNDKKLAHQKAIGLVL